MMRNTARMIVIHDLERWVTSDREEERPVHREVGEDYDHAHD
jgi:hypothetical protein